ncbi:2-hydroxyacid dehydrogenase [Limobrevibacterium gyesilva]|uniref:2-hydroxyacid dehydrogenase n=1 Tax=Limobrevibacterium gyesilva TaxID=2991712 RepID=A0AA41YTU7_9PROT|nr:2-hydroxyacid dehydrogenase [Limobrevibacterium gyesilva]MCW3475317.1 2-hydroxyacid dehydrogenase [Limobrevibacterium gyesilva]
MNASLKPAVIHLGAPMDPCQDRYRRHFRLHVLAAGAPPPAAVADESQAMITTAPVTAGLMDALPRLRLIAAFGAGVDRIDLAAAQARGITVTNTPGVTDACVADMAFGLLLATMRGIAAGDRFVRAGTWAAGPFALSHRVSGRRIGILGLGHIGRAIARRAEGFDMVVSYHSRHAVPGVPYARKDSVVALAADADILVIACPGGAATRHLVGAEVLRALGPRGVLVNIARGSIVDEAALIAALQTGGIAAAGLDVFAQEPEVPAALRTLDNVVLTPHRGGGTYETFEDAADLVIANLLAFFRGEAVPTPVGVV